MSFKFRNRVNIPRKKKELLDDKEKALGLALQKVVLSLNQRTKAGKSVEGSPFADYTPEYAKFKSRKGRSIAPPDLTFSGAMLRAIQFSVKRTANAIIGRIYFNSAKEANKARGNQEKRPFFGLSKEERDLVIDIVRGRK